MNDKIVTELDSAFKLISSIAVKGNDVDIMAVAKQHLRNVYTLLNASETKTEEVMEGSANGS